MSSATAIVVSRTPCRCPTRSQAKSHFWIGVCNHRAFILTIIHVRFTATTHIRYLEMTQQQLQTRLQAAEAETARLRHVNEALMLGTAEQRHAAAASAVAAAQQSSAQAPVY